jgi:bacterioferritin
VRTKPEIIERLNALLFNELTAINQYFLHARILKQWGFEELSERIYKESLGEMQHADAFIKRILFLEGLPNLQTLGKLHIGETVPEALSSDLTLERKARDEMVSSIAFFEREQDFVSRRITTNVLVDSEHHIDYLETQLELVQKLGDKNYLQSAVDGLEED